MALTINCVNCDQNYPEKAEFYYTGEKGVRYGLCGQCRGAFELGQVNPNAEIKPLKERRKHEVAGYQR